MNNFVEWLEIRDKNFLDSMILSEDNLVRGPVWNTIINKYELEQIVKKGKLSSELYPQALKPKIEKIIENVQKYLENIEFVTEEDWNLFKKDPRFNLIADDAYAYVMRSSYWSAGQGGGSGDYGRQKNAITDLCGTKGPGIGFATINLPTIPYMSYRGGAYNALVWESKAKANAYRAGAGGAAGAGAAVAEEQPASGGLPRIQRRPLPGDAGYEASKEGKVPGKPDAKMNPSGNIAPKQQRQNQAQAKQKPAEPEVPDIFGPRNQMGTAIMEKYKKLDMSNSPDPLKQAAGDLFKDSQMIAYYDGNLNRIAVVSTMKQEPILNNKPPKNKELSNPEAGRPVIVTPANNETSGIVQAIMKAWEDSHGGNPIDLAALGNPWKGRKKPNGQPIEFSDDVKILNRPLRKGETYPNQYVISSERTDKTYGAGSEYRVPSRNTEVPTVWNKQLGARVPYR